MEKRNISDEDYHKIRAEIEHHGIRGLFLINGGAILALLAFLQAIWDKDKELALVIVNGLPYFCVGLLLAASVSFFRYHTSRNYQAGNIKTYLTFKGLSLSSRYISLLIFALGLYKIFIGLKCLLNA